MIDGSYTYMNSTDDSTSEKKQKELLNFLRLIQSQH